MDKPDYVFAYELEDGTKVAAVFQNENDLDGCEISIKMYQGNLGPITKEVWERMVKKFNGKPC